MSIRGKQEVNVETVNGTISNPLMVEFEERLKTLALSPSTSSALAMWNAFVMEARTTCAKLIVTLENISFNVSPFVTTSLAWLILTERIPETSRIRPALVHVRSNSIPQLFIHTRQPEDLLPHLRQIWGDEHPFAQPELVTDMQAMPLSHLSDCVILNQLVHVGRDTPRRSMPYPGTCEIIYEPDKSAFAGNRELEFDFKNFEFVSAHPMRFLKWVVTKEIRDTVFPQVINMLKSDPTRVEYTRISDEEAKRISQVQEEEAASLEKS